MRARLAITTPSGERQEVSLGDTTRIGRAANSEVVIAEPRVSRRHAVIRREPDGDFVVTDLGSANGTFVNGVPVALPVTLHDGDRIAVGGVELSFVGSEGRSAEAHVGDTLFASVDSTIESESSSRGAAVRLIGTGPAMVAVLSQVRQAASTPIPVLVTGETGTGKELVSRAIHEASPRRNGPFVPINCSALPESLLESELFGHRRGSFTGAIRDRQGLFEVASGGTVFLDEIGELPLSLQPKLLRVLQDGEIRALGEAHERRVDVRVTAATNRDLPAEVERGSFREDLFYRLSAFTIDLPPLRERREDIALLAERLLHATAAYQKKHVRGIDPAALDALAHYDWPGNVRELENELARAVAILEQGERIELDHLSPRVLGISAAAHAPPSKPARDAKAVRPGSPASEELREATLDFERQHIAEVLAKHGGNVSRAAQALGLSRGGLHKKLKELGLR